LLRRQQGWKFTIFIVFNIPLVVVFGIFFGIATTGRFSFAIHREESEEGRG